MYYVAHIIARIHLDQMYCMLRTVCARYQFIKPLAPHKMAKIKSRFYKYRNTIEYATGFKCNFSF